MSTSEEDVSGLQTCKKYSKTHTPYSTQTGKSRETSTECGFSSACTLLKPFISGFKTRVKLKNAINKENQDTWVRL